ncbi:unnamed protein product, partial [Mesorhabditis belari]|uniref:C-type lectin domain-containing protein n=1 Tax=Mesorhabditis belari TaxID=2138241 RepID=A0AAF3EN08_9BILA
MLFFLLLFFKSANSVDNCQTLFVIDGSSYSQSFRGEITSIATTASLAFSSSNITFSANFWVYGAGDNDEEFPDSFFLASNDFDDNVRELQQNGGSETIFGATSKLNQWKIHDAVVVIYTASPQNFITLAGANYTEQARTIAVHLNDGVDLSSISNYPSPAISDYINILQLIINVCGNLPKTTPATFSTTTDPNGLNCLPSDHQPMYNCRQGWQYNSITGYQYLVFYNSTFTDGEAYCVSQGGHLTSIHSQEENDWITSLCCPSSSHYDYHGYYSAYIVGGRKDNKTFSWTDGTPFDYEHHFCFDHENVTAAISITNCDDKGCCAEGSWVTIPIEPAEPLNLSYLVCKKK